MPKTLLLEFSSKQVRQQRRIMRENLWWDTIHKKMHKIWGSKIDLYWNEEAKNMIPRVKWDEDEKRWETKGEAFETFYEKKNNKEIIKDWIENIGNRLGAELNREETSNKGIAIDCDNSSLPVIEYSLDRYEILFEAVT